eukprot:6487944-Amphidinium_carterae.2
MDLGVCLLDECWPQYLRASESCSAVPTFKAKLTFQGIRARQPSSEYDSYVHDQTLWQARQLRLSVLIRMLTLGIYLGGALPLMRASKLQGTCGKFSERQPM